MRLNRQGKHRLSATLFHFVSAFIAIAMLYPILWQVASSLKPTSDIFSHPTQLVPRSFEFQNYVRGWQGFGGITFGRFFGNTFLVVLVSTVGAVVSSAMIAFGLARVRFRFRRFWFGTVILTLLLPAQLVTIPQYIIFHLLGVVNTYVPLILPTFFGMPFFIFLIMQFIRGIPIELDESAEIDGCTRFVTFRSIILPLLTPALVTCAIFSFYWGWDNFFQPLIYLQNPALYTISVAVRLFSDPQSQTDWGAMFAMSTLSLVPPVVFFFVFQKNLVEGIATTGLKG